jgi:hypothetical protein
VRVIVAVVMFGALVLPAHAGADSGSITDVRTAPDGSVVATYTATSTTCDDIGFCGWYPHALEVPASSACYFDQTYFTYIGDYQDQPGTQTATDPFTPHYNPTRVCLSINGPLGERFVAEYVYTAPAPAPATPTPAPAPPSSPAPAPAAGPLTVTEARRLVPRVLRDAYGRRYTRRTGRLRARCHRLAADQVRCRVHWKTRAYRYAGNVTLRSDAAGPAGNFRSDVAVHRERRHERSAEGRPHRMDAWPNETASPSPARSCPRSCSRRSS